jgi:quercetin dioxygenase-like cupin family protein
MNNLGRYKVGKASDFAKDRGWFFGHFADDPLLKSELIEVAWQDISGKKASAEDKHLHKSSVEVNIVTSGEVTLTIGGETFVLHKGEFYVIWPETVVENVSASEHAEIIVIRAPSVSDKVNIS